MKEAIEKLLKDLQFIGVKHITIQTEGGTLTWTKAEAKKK